MKASLRRRARAASALLAVAALSLTGTATANAAAESEAVNRPVTIQLLNVSDFHGQLDPLNIFGVGDVGGAAALSSYWQADRAQNPNTLLLTAGDAVGASPPLSSFFQDTPTIEWMNYTNFTADTFGNHNFDAGLGRLQDQIDLANFDYVSANLRNVPPNLSGVSPFQIYDVAGVKVAVIGLTNPEAPSLVTPGNLGTLRIADPVKAALAAKAVAQQRGATVFVAIGHLGVTQIDPDTGAASGPLVDFAQSVRGFDVILGDHTDVQYSDRINNQLVLENKSKGATYAKTRIVVDPRSGTALRTSSQFIVPLVSNVTPDPGVVALLQPYRDQLAAELDGVIGTSDGILPRGGTPAVERVQEVAIGDLVTDAIRTTYDTQIAFTNGGGLRSEIPSSYLPQDMTLRRPSPGYAAGPPYDLVAGDIYTLLPFGNSSVTRTVTGSQLWDTMEYSVGDIPAANGKFLQISGYKIVFDAARPSGSRLVSMTLDDGTPIPNDPSFVITATTNDFTNSGGDGYTMLADGMGVTRDLLANDVLDYVSALTVPVSTATYGRITQLN